AEGNLLLAGRRCLYRRYRKPHHPAHRSEERDHCDGARHGPARRWPARRSAAIQAGAAARRVCGQQGRRLCRRQRIAPRPAVEIAARRALPILFAVNVLNFYDRGILAALAEPVRLEFGLSDTQIGFMTTSFTLLYAIAGVPLGRLADRSSRKKLLAGGVSVWSLLTA